MKKLLLFLLIPVLSHAQFWTVVANLPSDSDGDINFSQLSVPDSQTIWATTVAANGETITHRWRLSTDGGATWTQGDINTGNASPWMGSFCAVSATKAFAAMIPASLDETGGIWKTEDAGATWTQIPDLYQTAGSSFPNVIHFYDAQNGTITGDPENGYFEIYNTSDGGATWTRVASENIAMPLGGGNEYGYINEVGAFGNTIWVETNLGRILKSTDAGASWTAHNTPAMDFSGLDYFDFDFKNQNDGLLIRFGHENFTTSDGGATWQEYFPTQGAGLTPRDKQILSIPDSDGSYFSIGADVDAIADGASYSPDNGITWHNMNLIDDNPIVPATVRFVSEDLGFAIGTYLTEENSPANYKIFRHDLANASIDDLLQTKRFESFGISVYPNPTDGLVKLSGANITAIHISDLSGKVVSKQNYNRPDEAIIDMTRFQDGIYLAKVSDVDGGWAIVRIVKY